MIDYIAWAEEYEATAKDMADVAAEYQQKARKAGTKSAEYTAKARMYARIAREKLSGAKTLRWWGKK